jgi:hypothetical protein
MVSGTIDPDTLLFHVCSYRFSTCSFLIFCRSGLFNLVPDLKILIFCRSGLFNLVPDLTISIHFAPSTSRQRIHLQSFTPQLMIARSFDMLARRPVCLHACARLSVFIRAYYSRSRRPIAKAILLVIPTHSCGGTRDPSSSS